MAVPRRPHCSVTQSHGNLSLGKQPSLLDEVERRITNTLIHGDQCNGQREHNQPRRIFPGSGSGFDHHHRNQRSRETQHRERAMIAVFILP